MGSYSTAPPGSRVALAQLSMRMLIHVTSLGKIHRKRTLHNCCRSVCVYMYVRDGATYARQLFPAIGEPGLSVYGEYADPRDVTRDDPPETHASHGV